jgi:hypothetical protein
MNTEETPTTAVTPLVALGDADASVCADGFCALPSAPVPTAETKPGGMGK